jgi:hypothetical protein
MKLDGGYTDDEATTPDHIRVTGTDQEWARVGPLPDVSGGTATPTPVADSKYDPFRGWTVTTGHKKSADIPADRGLVRDITRKVEVECDDERLIDWMKG